MTLRYGEFLIPFETLTQLLNLPKETLFCNVKSKHNGIHFETAFVSENNVDGTIEFTGDHNLTIRRNTIELPVESEDKTYFAVVEGRKTVLSATDDLTAITSGEALGAQKVIKEAVLYNSEE